MNIAKEMERQLAAQLKANEARFIAEQEAARAALPSLAEKAHRDAVAGAQQAAEDAQRRCDAQMAERLESLVGRGGDLSPGSPSERSEWLERTGVSAAALGRAAGCGGPVASWVAADDLTIYDTHLPPQPAPAGLIDALRALHYLYNSLLSGEERAAEAKRDAARKEALEKLADERVAVWKRDQDAQRKIDG
jgi:hypothetical protein